MNWNSTTNDHGIDFSTFDLEDQSIAARRMRMYSDAALDMALPINDIYLSYTEFSEGLAGLDRIFQLSTRVKVPQGLQLVGPTGSGKTTLLRYFLSSLPPSSLFSPGLGAVYVRVPMRASVAYVLGRLLRIYGYPFLRITSSGMEQRIAVVLDAIRQKGTQMILFDEAHNLASEAQRKRLNPEEGTSLTDLIRHLMDEGVGVVLASVGSLNDIAGVDSALANRVVGRFSLKPFEYDAAWIRLLNGFVLQIKQFDTKVLMVPDVSQKLHKLTQGNLRGLKRVLIEMVLVAVDDGAQSVEVKHLRKAHDLVYGMGARNGNPFERVAA